MRFAATVGALVHSRDISGVPNLHVLGGETLPTCNKATQHEKYKNKPLLLFGVPAARNDDCGSSSSRVMRDDRGRIN